MPFYSPSTRGFYDIGIATVIPEDAIEVSEAERQQLLLEQAEGRVIEFRNGRLFTEEGTPNRTWDEIRALRDKKLQQSDWTQMADAPLTQQQKAAWTAYRAALRNLPQDFPEPDQVVWPDPPTS